MLKLFANRENLIEANNIGANHTVKPTIAKQGIISASLIALTMFALGSQNSQAGQVGSSTGIFTVDAGGQANYSMSIEVPPGILGVQPQVSISYSSGSGNGLLGLGGGLNGLSSISRCGSNIAQDGFARPVVLDQYDYFCLNGQRLVQSSGSTYGANNAKYHTLIESFQLVTSHGAVNYPNGGSSPESFSVLGKGGSKLVFGADANSRSIDEQTGVPISWKISYLEDKNGNRVDYTYQDLSTTDSNGIKTIENLPESIRYGRNDSAGVAGELHVDFIYENRPDQLEGFTRGHKGALTKRLSNIQTRVGNDVVKDYRVGYEQTPVSGISRIKTLTECAGNGQCLLPVTFTWQEADTSWTSSNESLPEPLLTAEGYQRGEMTDLNNDGWVDLLISYRKADGTQEQSAYLRDVNGWQSDSNYVLPEVLNDYQLFADGAPIGRLIDITGDALPDFVVSYESQGQTFNTVYENTGSGWQAIAEALPSVLMAFDGTNPPQARASLMDVNGDALIDVVQAVQLSDGTVQKNTWLNQASQPGKSWQLSADHQFPVALINYTGNPEGTVEAEIEDINNDGLIDFIQSFVSPNGVTTNRVLLGEVDSAGIVSWTESSIWALPVVMNNFATDTKGINETQLLDINGDGLNDVVQAHEYADGSVVTSTWLNTGNGFQASSEFELPTSLVKYSNAPAGLISSVLVSVSDINGDGKPDVVQSYLDETGQHQSSIWLRENDTWAVDNTLLPPLALTQLFTDQDSRTYALPVDVNNDGRVDQLVSKEGETDQVHLSGVSNSAVAYPTLLTEVIGGFGSRHTIEYTLGLHDGVYTPDSDGAYPNIDAAGPMLLIKAVEATDGAGGFASATTHFFGKKTNVLGRGSLGFREKRSADGRTNIQINSYFNQNFPHIGQVVRFEKRTQAGVLLEESDSQFQTLNLFNGLTILPTQPSKTTRSYELDGSLIKTSAVSSTLDSLGNVLEAITDTTDSSGATFRQKVTTEYSNDVGEWLIGRPTRIVKTAEAPGVPSINSENKLYYSRYLVIKKELEPSHAHKLTQLYEYNDFGHTTKTTITAAGLSPRESSATYTADGRFVATATNTIGHSATSEFEPHFGKVTRTVDANGRETLKLYDEFARQIKETKVRLESDGINHTAEDDQGDVTNVMVFHLCNPVAGSVLDENGVDVTPAANPSCPDSAVYYAGAVDNESEAPETVYMDAKHRQVRKQTQGFDGSSVYIDTVYDDYGRKAKTSLPYFKDDTPRWTSYEYDILGRVTKAYRPDGTYVMQSYNGNTSVATNVLGQTTTTVVDARGKPVTVTDNMGNTISYTYDAAGKLLTTNNQGNVITVEYDDLGRKIRQDDPDLGLWTYEYDAFGQMISQIDAKGQKTRMEYDVMGRVIKRIDGADATALQETTTQWEYDTAANGLGKLAKVWDSNGYTREHVFDQYGRPFQSTVTVDGETHVTETGYLNVSADKLDYIRYPSGLMVRKTYNEYGFPLEIRSNGLVEYEQYAAKVLEAESLLDQAVVYQTNHEAERTQLVSDYEAEVELGNADQNQASHYYEIAESHVGEYNARMSALQNAYASYEQERKKAEFHRDEAIRYGRIAADAVLIKEGDDYKKDEDGEYIVRDGVSRGEGKFAEKYSNWSENHEKEYEKHKAELDRREDHVNLREAQANEARSVIEGYQQTANEWANKAQVHYRAATNYSNQIDAIDDEIDRLSQLSEAASDKAELLLEEYQGSSLAHWEALSADAEGKVLRFKQGKHVTTNVAYEASTGRLKSVIASSDASVEAQNTEYGYDATVAKLNDWLGELQTAQTQYTSTQNAAIASKAAANNQRDIAITNADFYRNGDNVALALLEDAEKHRLDVEMDNQQVVIDLNQQLVDLTGNALTNIEGVLASHSETSEYRVSLLNIAFYQAKSDYHNAVEALYRETSVAQAANTDQYRAFATQTPEGINELNALSEKALKLSIHHANRQVTFDSGVYRGFGSVASELENQYTDPETQENLSRLVGDVYRNRGEVYESQSHVLSNLYKATQGLNSVVSGIHDYQGNALMAQHYQENTQIGNDTVNSYQNLGALYKQRADDATTEQAQEALDDVHYSASNKASFQFLSSEYRAKSETYAEMAEPVFWQTFFNGLGDTQVDLSNVYLAQAEQHNRIAQDNYELMEDARNEIDHSVIGFNGIVLNDRYEWDALGNLTTRYHGVANANNDGKEATVDLTQQFEYDGLNRLVSTQLSGKAAEYYEITEQTTQTIQYDSVGNITYKSDVGTYEYGNNAGPHAVTRIYGSDADGHKNADYAYDENGNMVSGDGRTIAYSVFNKPIDIERNGNRSEFTYGPERQLVKEIRTDIDPNNGNQASTKTIYSFGAYEKTIEGVNTTHKYHISTTNGTTIAVLIDKQDDLPRTNYLHRDHLDSIVAITDERGFVLERFHYDAFGQRRIAVGITGAVFTNTIDLSVSDRGYTGHKMLDKLQLIHMRGRVYDPTIGRFLSADPHIQFAGHTQSYNRYSYVMNNPLSFNDPSGYFLSWLFKPLKNLLKKIANILKKVVRIVKKVIKKVKAFVKKYWRVILAVVIAVYTGGQGVTLLKGLGASSSGAFLTTTTTTFAGLGGGGTAFAFTTTSLSIAGAAAVGAIAGGLTGLIMTGSLKGALKGAVLGAITGGFARGLKIGGGAFAKIRDAGKFARRATEVVGHGVIGGIRSDWNGGSFSKGFTSASFGKAATPYVVDNFNGIYAQGLGVATVGGLSSKLAGGKFEDGFYNAGVGFATNFLTNENVVSRTIRSTKNFFNNLFDKDTIQAEFGSSVGDVNDAYRHAVGSRVKAELAGYTVAETLGYANEIKNFITQISDTPLNQIEIEARQDIINNLEGLNSFTGNRPINPVNLVTIDYTNMSLVPLSQDQFLDTTQFSEEYQKYF